MSADRDAILGWVLEQQAVAERSVEHNKTAVHVRGCVECGRTDTPVAYLFGRADHPRCLDRDACIRRREALYR